MIAGEGCRAVASHSDAEAGLLLSANELRLGNLEPSSRGPGLVFLVSSAVSTSAHTDCFFFHAIAAKISCAVAGSAGAVSCFIDSALKSRRSAWAPAVVPRHPR